MFCSGCLGFHPQAPSKNVNLPSLDSGPIHHILFCTALGVGHYTPVANFISALFVDSLHRDRLRVTFFTPIRAWELKSCEPPSVSGCESSKVLRCHQVPLSGDDIHPITMNGMISRRKQLFSELHKVLFGPCGTGIHEDDPASDWPPVSVVVHDFFAIYAFEYAEKKLRVPRVIFNPSHSLCFKWLADLDLNTRILRGERQMKLNGFKTPCDIQLVGHMMTLGPPEPVFESYNVKRMAKTAMGMITTDIESLFPEQLAEIRTLITDERRFGDIFGHFSMFYSGPTCVFRKPKPAQLTDTVEAWLNAQAEQSVIFVALGTLYPIPLTALQALMKGIETYRRPFLWAYKSRGETREEARQMLQDFKDRTIEFGRVADWVDQRMVLHHPALRVFVSHGGWNSLVESLTFAGVPIVCVPLGSEQPVNAMVVRAGLGIGVVAMEEDLDWLEEHRSTFASEEELEAAIERMQRDSTDMLNVMKPMMRVKFRFPTDTEWMRILAEACDTKFVEYLVNAKQAQVKILKSAIPNGSQSKAIDGIVGYLMSLQGVIPPDSGDMSPILSSP